MLNITKEGGIGMIQALKSIHLQHNVINSSKSVNWVSKPFIGHHIADGEYVLRIPNIRNTLMI